MFVSCFASPIQDLWHRWKSIQCGYNKPHSTACSTSSKQQRLHFIPPVSQSFTPWKQLNFYRISPCSSGHGALTNTHLIAPHANLGTGNQLLLCPREPSTTGREYAQPRSILPGSSLCVGASATFLPRQETYVWVRHIYRTFLSLLVR